jgi:hypothetical protein
MSKGLFELIKKHPRLIAEYRNFIVTTLTNVEAKKITVASIEARP